MISATVRCWYRFCAWYFCHVTEGVERRRMKLEAELSHQRKRQQIVHKQQSERLEMNLRHERELLAARHAYLNNFTALMQLFSIRDTPFMPKELEGAILVDHEILIDSEDTLP